MEWLVFVCVHENGKWDKNYMYLYMHIETRKIRFSFMQTLVNDPVTMAIGGKDKTTRAIGKKKRKNERKRQCTSQSW